MLKREIESVREGRSNTTWYYVKGPRGAVQFMLLSLPGSFLPADLGYHSPEPLYDGQESGGPCAVLDNKPCYYDGSGMNALQVMKVFHASGDDPESIWDFLENYYKEIFHA